MRRSIVLATLLSSALLLPSLSASAAGAAPVAVEDRYVAKPGKQLHVPTPGVLGNDSDPEKDRLKAVLNTSTSQGSLVLKADGSFRYTPTSAAGTDSFSYRASDGTTLSNPVFVFIKIDSTPVAQPDSYVVLAPNPRTVSAPGVLANDADADGDLIFAQLVRKPAYGQLSLNDDGSFVYTPDKRPRDDYFTYRAFNSTNRSSNTRVDLKIGTSNTAPVAVADTYVVQENSPLSVLPPGVLGNDTDADGDSLQAELLQEPFSDSFEFYPDGSFFYLMPTDWDTDVTFTYRVTDGLAYSAPVMVTIDIVAVNSPPVGEDDYYEMYSSDGTLEVAAPGVLGNDYDPVEFDGVHVDGLVGSPGHGDVTLRRDGSFTYTPEVGFVGTDGFSYRPADSQPGNVTFVTIVVNG